MQLFLFIYFCYYDSGGQQQEFRSSEKETSHSDRWHLSLNKYERMPTYAQL